MRRFLLFQEDPLPPFRHQPPVHLSGEQRVLERLLYAINQAPVLILFMGMIPIFGGCSVLRSCWKVFPHYFHFRPDIENEGSESVF